MKRDSELVSTRRMEPAIPPRSPPPRTSAIPYDLERLPGSTAPGPSTATSCSPPPAARSARRCSRSWSASSPTRPAQRRAATCSAPRRASARAGRCAAARARTVRSPRGGGYHRCAEMSITENARAGPARALTRPPAGPGQEGFAMEVARRGVGAAYSSSSPPDGRLVGGARRPITRSACAGRCRRSTRPRRRPARSPAAPAARSWPARRPSLRSDAGPRTCDRRSGDVLRIASRCPRTVAEPLPGQLPDRGARQRAGQRADLERPGARSAGSTAPRASRPGRAAIADDGFCGFTLGPPRPRATCAARRSARPTGSSCGPRAATCARSSPSAATGSTPPATRAPGCAGSDRTDDAAFTSRRSAAPAT